MLQNLKIGIRSGFAFFGIILITTGIGNFTYYGITQLSEMTSKLYKHPFAVSNAVRDTNGHIIAMHRSMKDVALSKTDAQLEQAVQVVSEYESRALTSLHMIHERFLGDKTLVHNASELFRNWKPIRDRVIDLRRAGEYEKAAEITRGEGARHVVKMENSMQTLLDFANNKADTFVNAVFAEQNNLQSTLGWGLLILTLVSISIAFIITRSITLPINNIALTLSQLASGDSKDSLQTKIPYQSRKDEVGIMARSAEQLRLSAVKSQQLALNNEHVAELSNLMQLSGNVNELSQAVMSYIAPLFHIGHGIFCCFNNQSRQLELTGSYAFEERKNLSNRFALGETLIGQCALEQKTIILTDAPENYVQISSALGHATPLNLIAIPIVYQENLVAVMELASFHPFERHEQDFLNSIIDVIAINLENMNRSTRTEELLRETQQQTEELKASEATMKEQKEEIFASNEELREKQTLLEQQTEELRARETDLQEQREELRASNEELQEKTDSLTGAKNILEKRTHELEQSSRYKSEFLANMSHELRTPLNSLLILSKLLRDNRQGNLTEDQVESASTIYNSGNHLLQLINDILDIAKVEAGKLQVSPDNVVLSDLIQTLEQRFTPMAEEKGIQCHLSIDKEMPEQIYTDGKRLEQIITNLMANAVKFTEQGSVQLNVSMKTNTHADINTQEAILIAVKDTGIGIPDELIETIFKSFEQADGSISRKYGGTGLGLNISSQLAQLLGGYIDVSSVDQKGSIFTLVLPYIAVDNTTALQSPVAPVAKTMTVKENIEQETNEQESYEIMSAPIEDDRKQLQKGDKPILVVEDDLQFASILRDEVRQSGLKCLVTSDGPSALGLSQQYFLSGIILDLNLPKMSGRTILQRLKASSKTKGIPVHIISALDNSGKEIAMGAMGYLTKPVSQKQIEQAIEKLNLAKEKQQHEILLIEDDPSTQKAVSQLLSSDSTKVQLTGNGVDALQLLKDKPFDLIILDLQLADMDGHELLEQIAQDKELTMPPVIIFTGKDLSVEETQKLQSQSDSVILKSTYSDQRLSDEVHLFLHNIQQHKSTPAASDETLTPHNLKGKTVLIVDDDMRNTFALSKALKAEGLKTYMASNGEECLKRLNEHDNIDIILMDIMMPVMDGYETTTEIRKQKKYKNLPILMLTAKAMQGDQDKSFEVGANEHITKPIDMTQLLSKLEVWTS
ncbi:MAG: response regulator [gamma proteobacterium symbiont of Taylorina sp.]|nr:response regulator [gamma proteobacterium symbiont of Taylorina sp.]